MRKIFFATLFALIVGVQNFCGAATIESAAFNNNVDMIYPVVHTGDAAVDEKINIAIIAEIDRLVTGVHRNAQANDFNVGYITSAYEVGANEAGGTVILSLLIRESWYYEGAAHPAHYLRTLNFNVGSGELMGLDYLTDVGAGVSESEILARLERALIKHCERENIMLFPDALPIKELPQNFYWDENLHVHFVFQNYDVAPYAAGIIDVDIDA